MPILSLFFSNKLIDFCSSPPPSLAPLGLDYICAPLPLLIRLFGKPATGIDCLLTRASLRGQLGLIFLEKYSTRSVLLHPHTALVRIEQPLCYVRASKYEVLRFRL